MKRSCSYFHCFDACMCFSERTNTNADMIQSEEPIQSMQQTHYYLL